MDITQWDASVPGPSVGFDHLTLSFQCRSMAGFLELMDEIDMLAKQLEPAGDWDRPRQGKHLAHAQGHPGGLFRQYSLPSDSLLSLGTSPADLRPDHGGSQKEMIPLVLELKGKACGRLSPFDRIQTISTLGRRPDFRRCTRIDGQRTWMDPPRSAEEICDDYDERKIWPYGYSSCRTWNPKNYQGEPVGGATFYIGSTKSQRMVRIYNKAAEQGWETPAVRVEVQARKDLAEGLFTEMMDRLMLTDPSPEEVQQMEETFTNEWLAADCDIRDISRWQGMPLPKKWAQTATAPAWWEEMLGDVGEKLKVQVKRGEELGHARENAGRQYGRALVLEIEAEARRTGRHQLELLFRWYAQQWGSVRPDDWRVLRKLDPSLTVEEAQGMVRSLRALAARIEEHDPEFEIKVAPRSNRGAQVPSGAPRARSGRGKAP